jgi:hypothetical protein
MQSATPQFGGSVNPVLAIGNQFIQPDASSLQAQQSNGLSSLGLLSTLPMQQNPINSQPNPLQQLQFDQEKVATPSYSNPTSVDFQAGSVQAKARYFSRVMQQNTLPLAPSTGPVPAQLQLPQTPSQGLNFNALVLPPQQTNDDIDAETNLQLPDGESIPAFEIEKNLLNALPCVAHAIVFGSKRSILAALLVLKSSNNSDPNLPLSSEGLLLASQFNSSVTTCR